MSSAWSRGQESQPGRRAEPAQGAKRQRLGRRDDGAPVCRGVSRQAISRGGCPGGTFCLNPACQTTKESLGGAQTISQHVQEKSADAVEAWVRSFHGEFALPEGTHRCICTSCYNMFKLWKDQQRSPLEKQRTRNVQSASVQEPASAMEVSVFSSSSTLHPMATLTPQIAPRSAVRLSPPNPVPITGTIHLESCAFCERECALFGSAIAAPGALQGALGDLKRNPREVHYRWTFGCNASYLGEEPDDAAINLIASCWLTEHCQEHNDEAGLFLLIAPQIVIGRPYLCRQHYLVVTRSPLGGAIRTLEDQISVLYQYEAPDGHTLAAIDNPAFLQSPGQPQLPPCDLRERARKRAVYHALRRVYALKVTTFGEVHRSFLKYLAESWGADTPDPRLSQSGANSDVSALQRLFSAAGVSLGMGVARYTNNLDECELRIKAFAEIQRVHSVEDKVVPTGGSDMRRLTVQPSVVRAVASSVRAEVRQFRGTYRAVEHSDHGSWRRALASE